MSPNAWASAVRLSFFRIILKCVSLQYLLNNEFFGNGSRASDQPLPTTSTQLLFRQPRTEKLSHGQSVAKKTALKSIFAGIETKVTIDIYGSQAMYFYQFTNSTLGLFNQDNLPIFSAYAFGIVAAWALGALIFGCLFASCCRHKAVVKRRHRD